jgi:16S rRNA processing protein RimM
MGAQGLKGEVKAKIFTATPDALPRYGRLHTQDGRTLTITAYRPGKEGEAVIAFAEVRDRNAAEALKGTQLFVARDALPAAGDEEFYHADLIGLDVRDPGGKPLGKVRAVHNHGAGDLLEISGAGADLLLPFTRAVIPTVDLTSGRIVADPPEGVE